MSELCASLRTKLKESNQRIRRMKGGRGDMESMSKKEWLALLLNTAEKG